jgi:class 3 adenylate cyclase
MESTGEPGKIQLSEAAYALLKDTFDLEARGEIEIKGKGKMKTWFLTGPRISPSP